VRKRVCVYRQLDCREHATAFSRLRLAVVKVAMPATAIMTYLRVIPADSVKLSNSHDQLARSLRGCIRACLWPRI
jgi:hypothetical protein